MSCSHRSTPYDSAVRLAVTSVMFGWFGFRCEESCSNLGIRAARWLGAFTRAYKGGRRHNSGPTKPLPIPPPRSLRRSVFPHDRALSVQARTTGSGNTMPTAPLAPRLLYPGRHFWNILRGRICVPDRTEQATQLNSQLNSTSPHLHLPLPSPSPLVFAPPPTFFFFFARLFVIGRFHRLVGWFVGMRGGRLL